MLRMNSHQRAGAGNPGRPAFQAGGEKDPRSGRGESYPNRIDLDEECLAPHEVENEKR